MTEIRHIFFDIGGVLGSNGWDREQRKHAVERFDLDPEDFQWRHEEVIGEWEEGRITLDEYLDIAVFYIGRPFSRGEFVAFISSCWIGVRKPIRRFYHRALGIAHCEPAGTLFIDDRQQNLTPATTLGMNVILFQSASQLRSDLERFLHLEIPGA